MRLRLLGYYVHASIAALAAIEIALFILSMFAGVIVRFAASLSDIEPLVGSVWPRAVLFGFATFLTFIAFGLYTARQRAQTFGLALRVVAAVLAATAAATVVFYLVPPLN